MPDTVTLRLIYQRKKVEVQVSRHAVESLFTQRDEEGLDLKKLGIGVRDAIRSVLSARFTQKQKTVAPKASEPSKAQLGFLRAIERELDISAPTEAREDGKAASRFIAKHKDQMPPRTGGEA